MKLTIEELRKVYARQQVKNAVRRGDIKKPSLCSKCGCIPRAGKNGRSRLHGHHPDYAQPLLVEWICASCHRKETPFPDKPGAPVFGSRNGNSRLSEDAVLEIKAAYANRKSHRCGIKDLAMRLGVHDSTLRRIARGEMRKWK